jgi:hypothetical protein
MQDEEQDKRHSTLRALIDLAEGSAPTACWDDRRAIELLRSRSTPAELRDLGASEIIIEHIFPRGHDR